MSSFRLLKIVSRADLKELLKSLISTASKPVYAPVQARLETGEWSILFIRLSSLARVESDEGAWVFSGYLRDDLVPMHIRPLCEGMLSTVRADGEMRIYRV